jgi:hypothetical protein
MTEALLSKGTVGRQTIAPASPPLEDEGPERQVVAGGHSANRRFTRGVLSGPMLALRRGSQSSRSEKQKFDVPLHLRVVWEQVAGATFSSVIENERDSPAVTWAHQGLTSKKVPVIDVADRLPPPQVWSSCEKGTELTAMTAGRFQLRLIQATRVRRAGVGPVRAVGPVRTVGPVRAVRAIHAVAQVAVDRDLPRLPSAQQRPTRASTRRYCRWALTTPSIACRLRSTFFS